MPCTNCDGTKWVCENHPEVPWRDGEGCCGGAGMPCVCSPMHRSKMKASERLKERFWKKVVKLDQCWIWHTRPKKYGFFSLNGKVMNASRASYLLNIGPIIPEKLDVCHKCNNKACVRPDHLYLGTRSQNMKDANKDGLLDNWKLKRRTKQFCKQDHNYKDNVKARKNGQLYCSECSRIAVRRYRASKK